MLKFVALVALIAVVTAAPLTLLEKKTPVEVIPIVKSVSDVQSDGSYTFSYEGGDGTVREEKGTLMNAGEENAFVAMTGSYRYIDAEGQTVEVHYTADEHGFVPTGTIIHDSVASAARLVSLNTGHEDEKH